MTRREQAVVDAAVNWFLDLCPRNTTPATHLERPTMRRGSATLDDAEGLAVAVAELLRWRKHVATRRGAPCT